MEEKLYYYVNSEHLMTSKEATTLAERAALANTGDRYVVVRAVHSVKVEQVVKRTDYPPEAAATAAPDDDGWITWNGGERPVAPDVRVQVKFRCGSDWVNCCASDFRWDHAGVERAASATDIVAYRIAKPEATTAKPYAPSYNHTK
jgi:hypothetical protein